ncbi:DUF3099 domain-containing protein [Streptomyces luteolus]|uniref:DUF3099 domain-containing protein n=1 Tax=Streptomyces luteolus TaxID=3043615 RepID=A0ABT6T6Y5_9ACTN|nr:DUF3099 domain-containing protein [Streptomyces sp. B-S-A12]MDI3423425.1 DUF3099 domain-containing protein [Streptomyces sp. B-S-A12]
MRKHNNVEVFRITGARQGLADDVRGRQRRYVISMSVRTVAVILAAVLWNVERHVAIVALVLGILLPYIAVVIANAGRENAPSLPSTYVPTPVRPMLDAPSQRDSAEEAGRTQTTESAAGTGGAGQRERAREQAREQS